MANNPFPEFDPGALVQGEGGVELPEDVVRAGDHHQGQRVAGGDPLLV